MIRKENIFQIAFRTKAAHTVAAVYLTTIILKSKAPLHTNLTFILTYFTQD